MMKKRSGRTAAFLLSICMLVGMLPVEIQAANQQTYTLNWNQNGVIAGINDPTSGATWSGSKVYLGSYDNTPILWRVLDSKADEITAHNAMLLQTDAILKNSAYSGSSNQWQGSDIQQYLNGDFLKGLTTEEKNSIVGYSKPAGASTVDGNVSYTNPSLNGTDKVFLLSATDVLAEQYGYELDSARSLSVSTGNASSWWLRSGIEGDETKGVTVDRSGKLTGQPISENSTMTEAGVAPAMYLNLENILFTTPADQAKPGSFKKITNVSGVNNWKLTLQLSGTANGSLSGGTNTYTRGDNIAISHKSAATVLGGATQMSAVLMDSAGKPVYYGKINDSTGSVSNVTLPTDLPAGNYTIYVFAEDVNENKVTDYASELGDGLNIVVKATPQMVTLPSAATITYGQSLADAPISGGLVIVDGNPINGTFSWQEGAARPAVADSGVTRYGIVFTPENSVYNTITGQLTIQVDKSKVTPGMPSSPMKVDYATGKVKEIPLAEGWTWKTEDGEKDLVAGIDTYATAIYKDNVNYENHTVQIVIVKVNCRHTDETEVRNVKAATCTEKGYSGDTYCKTCGLEVSKGQETAPIGHNYIGVVTKEPTENEEGVKTFTCSSCGHQYTEAIAKKDQNQEHKHYYDKTRTIKWLGCEQQGEIEHYCSCGDSYVVVTPALGHAFTAKVTINPTNSRAGVKTYTCSRCGHAYTEAMPKLSGGMNSDNSGSSNKNSASNENGSGDTITDDMPYVKGNSSISGWNDINKMLTKAPEGDEIIISMDDSLILPKKTIEALKGKNVTLMLDIGNDMSWEIKGTEITGENLADFNLKVTKNTNAIPSDVITNTVGDLPTLQISLIQEGDFGATATLKILIDPTKSGYYANLFYYNSDTGTLEYISSSQMDGKGIASLSMTHASDYLIAIDTKIVDGTQIKEPEPTETTEPSTASEETAPVTVTPDATEGTPWVTTMVIMGAVILGIGILFIIILWARSKQPDYEE